MYCFSTMEEFSIVRESIKEELVQTVGKDSLRIFVALNEGVNNAIIHGNKEDDSKKVYLTMEKSLDEIKIVIRDEGNGFSNQDIPVETPWFEEHGRGIQLMQQYMDSYRRNECGNEITLVKKLDKA